MGLRLAMAFQMLFPGAPAIYYGDELGTTGENDPGCRGGMAWDTPDKALHAWQKRS
ncbi:MAG: alpha-amylase family glycosyl hydrolase [Lachnospiraceae bacterium]